MYLTNLPVTITNFTFENDAQDDKAAQWLKITKVNNVGLMDKEIRQKVIRLSPEEQITLFNLMREKFDA